MKAKPILFSAAMVRALLNGTKTQTRRTVKKQPPDHADFCLCKTKMCGGNRKWHLGNPYGQPGDHLWVREEHYQFGHWEPVEGKLTKGGRQKWRFVPDDSEVLFDIFTDYRKGRHSADPATPAWHKRLARFMPRKYSRITLEVVSVRVERLQEISAEDSIAEGIRVEKGSGPIEGQDCYMMTTNSGYMRGKAGAIAAYQNLWESINGPGSWNLNPWVWVVEFRRVVA